MYRHRVEFGVHGSYWRSRDDLNGEARVCSIAARLNGLPITSRRDTVTSTAFLKSIPGCDILSG